MKILLIPLLVIFCPFIILILVLYYLNQAKKISLPIKIGLGLFFVALSLLSTYFAMIISMHGMSEKGISCMTGALVFIPIGFIVSFVGIPMLLTLSKDSKKENFELSS